MKGILYSIIAALLIIPIMGLILFHSQITEKNIDTNIRANELEYFSISIEEDLSRFLKIAGKRALISAVSKVVTVGVPLVDAQGNLTEMIINGTLDGVTAPLVNTNNLEIWKENVTDIASSSGFDLDIQIVEVNITQNDSFIVLFEASIFANISDSKVKMGVAKNLTARVIIPIEDIEDPLFPLQTYGRVIRIIQISNFNNFTKDLVQGTNASIISVNGNATIINSSDLNPGDEDSSKILVTDNITDDKKDIITGFKGVVTEIDYIPIGFSKPYIVGASNARTIIEENQTIYLDPPTMKVWDLQNLTLFVKNKLYKESIDGPSFLDRLEGKLNLSSKYKYGLETFIHLKDDLERQELYPLINDEVSCVNYLYWNNTTGNSIRNPTFDWLKIDSAHEDDYGVEGLTS